MGLNKTGAPGSTLRQRIGRLLTVRHYFPFTLLGLLVLLCGSWISLSLGQELMDFVLHAAGALALLLLGLSLISVLLGSIWLWWYIRQTPGEVDLALETDHTAASGFRVPSLSIFPLIQLQVLWEEPPGIAVTLKPRAGFNEEMICPGQRGETQTIVRRFLLGDIFGFCRLGLAKRYAGRLLVSPRRARVTAHGIQRHLTGDALSIPSGPPQGELIEMRRYVYGDPLRHVLWKAFARTRKLLVRTPERAITPLPSVAAYLVSGPQDEPTASGARFFLEEGLLGQEYLFCADGAAEPTSDVAEALHQIIVSVRFRQLGAAGLDRFLRRLDETRRKNVVLFVPPFPGPWLDRLEALSAGISDGRVITALDYHPKAPGPVRWQRLLFKHHGTAERSLSGLAEVVRRLGRCGLKVDVLHRPTGEFLAPPHLEALGAHSS